MLEVEGTYATITCGAPTAHALGLSHFGLIELEEELFKCGADMEARTCTYALRKSVCVSQSLSILVTAFMAQLELCLQNMLPSPDAILLQWAHAGFLIGFESLVSTQGKELFMLSDAWIAVKSLERFALQLVQNNDAYASITLLERTSNDGNPGFYTVQLALPSLHFSRLPQVLQDGQLISITTVLFTQGINEMQTLVNAVGAAGVELQMKINETSLMVRMIMMRDLVFDYLYNDHDDNDDMMNGTMSFDRRPCNNTMHVYTKGMVPQRQH